MEFRLQDDPPPARLLIRPGSRRNSLLGLVIGIVSSVLTPFAVGTLAIGGVGASGEHQVGPPGWLSTNQRIAVAGGISLGLCLTGIVAGWTLYGTSGTEVVQGPL